MQRKEITAGEFVHDLYERLVLAYGDTELAALMCSVAATERGGPALAPEAERPEPPRRSEIRLPRVSDDLCTRLVRNAERAYAASADLPARVSRSGLGVPSARVSSPCDAGLVEFSP